MAMVSTQPLTEMSIRNLRYGPKDRGVGVRVTVASRIFSSSSRPALGPTQPPIQWIPGALSPGKAAGA
jgi:hypothetical protein